MKIFIHGWASGPQVWPASLTKGESFLYDGAEFPEFSDLEQTVKKLWQTRREKMIVVGWSLGGMLALQLAHAHPEWIEKLVLLSSTSRFTTDGLYTEGLPPSSVKSLSRRLNRRQRETQKNFYREMFADAETEAAEKFSEISPVFFSLPGTGLQKGLNYLLQTDLRKQYPHVRFRGIMGMATNTYDEAEIRRCFRQLAEIFKGHNGGADWDTLSMGMSEDYEIAIACGANMVRIGSTIFGERQY